MSPTTSDLLESAEYRLAQAFRDELLALTTARGRATISRLWAACDEMLRSGETITVAEIGRRLTSKYGGPKAQSIRDQPSRLKRLVDLCAAIQRKSEAEQHRVKLGSIVPLITDSTLQARVRWLEESSARDRQDALAAKRALQRLAPVRDLTPEQCYGPFPQNPSSSSGALSPNQSTLSEPEKQSIRDFLDPTFLYNEGLRIDEALGLLNDETGRIVMPVTFVRALRKISGS
ncbi:gamma-mobile-trio protein GmtX [Microvirga massiliensis]|uniref:gamma-mobile-trio protein GmtX n=1 Tax=Microvirga massiliensis TaxID=1033741 RepID=UPI000B2F04B5